jgi:hypothetical protein
MPKLESRVRDNAQIRTVASELGHYRSSPSLIPLKAHAGRLLENLIELRDSRVRIGLCLKLNFGPFVAGLINVANPYDRPFGVHQSLHSQLRLPFGLRG